MPLPSQLIYGDKPVPMRSLWKPRTSALGKPASRSRSPSQSAVTVSGVGMSTLRPYAATPAASAYGRWWERRTAEEDMVESAGPRPPSARGGAAFLQGGGLQR